MRWFISNLLLLHRVQICLKPPLEYVCNRLGHTVHKGNEKSNGIETRRIHKQTDEKGEMQLATNPSGYESNVVTAHI